MPTDQPTNQPMHEPQQDRGYRAPRERMLREYDPRQLKDGRLCPQCGYMVYAAKIRPGWYKVYGPGSTLGDPHDPFELVRCDHPTAPTFAPDLPGDQEPF